MPFPMRTAPSNVKAGAGHGKDTTTDEKGAGPVTGESPVTGEKTVTEMNPSYGSSADICWRGAGCVAWVGSLGALLVPLCACTVLMV